MFTRTSNFIRLEGMDGLIDLFLLFFRERRKLRVDALQYINHD
ncbi:hypothetical protein [Exiguobacterium sp.]|nr:hypothetical protein [Exiguobacterium sp.]